MTGTFTLSGGGTLAAGGARQATATVLVPINEIELGNTGGTGSLGPQPLDREPLTGGGALTFIAPHHPTATFTLSGGGDLSFSERHATGTFSLTGGGALAVVGRHTRAISVTGGGALTVTGLHVRTISVTGGGSLSAGVLRIDPNALLLPCAELLLDVYPLLVGTPPPPPPVDLVITLVNDTIESPGSLVAVVGNGTPQGAVVFSVHHLLVATDVLSTDFDDTGAVGGISVPINVATETTYDLVATDTTTAATASVPFTVTAVNTAATIGVPVTTPPTNVQTGIGVKKWVFQDPATNEVYHFPINPNKMNSPYAPKRILFQATTAIDGARLAFEGQAQPVDWQFEGTLFAKAQYDAFVTWFTKRNRIWVTDHYGRAWLVYLTVFNPTPRRAVEQPWCHDWSITALIFEGPVTPT